MLSIRGKAAVEIYRQRRIKGALLLLISGALLLPHSPEQVCTFQCHQARSSASQKGSKGIPFSGIKDSESQSNPLLHCNCEFRKPVVYRFGK